MPSATCKGHRRFTAIQTSIRPSITNSTSVSLWTEPGDSGPSRAFIRDTWRITSISRHHPPETWINIDAHIYGIETRWNKEIVNGLTLDAGYAWQRWRKDDQPANNADKDLSEIPPWKTRLGLEYEKNRWAVRAEWLHSVKASQIDEEAGEVQLADWDVVNLTASYHYSEHWSFHLGVENLFDESYAVANSYEYDVVSGSAVTPPIVYEPGRMVYFSLISRW